MAAEEARGAAWDGGEVIHYHGTPITPRSVLNQLAGKHFCVSFAAPNDVAACHQIGQSVMLDNGAFSVWRAGHGGVDLRAYWQWAAPWLDCKTTWCVIPDAIDADEEVNSRLLAEWFSVTGRFRQCAPVWHLHESFEYLDRLVTLHERVCFGSSGQYSRIGSVPWDNRMNEVFNRICKGSGSPPAAIHMLRGMSLSGSIYPFASVDSTDVARNHNRPHNNARRMADLWDAQQCPIRWVQQHIQAPLEVMV